MSVEDNKAVIRRLYDEAVAQGNTELVYELVSEDFVEHERFLDFPTEGPEALKAAFDRFKGAFPNLQIVADELIGEGDKVVARGTMSGTHKGEFLGIPPTNKSFKVPLIDIFEIRDGKMTAHWGMTDQGAMMEQLGIAPEM